MIQTIQRLAGPLVVVAGLIFGAAVVNAQNQGKEFRAALAVLDGHLQGREVLEPKRIEELTAALRQHQEQLDDDEAIRACDAFIRAYDRKYQPLWIGHPALNTKTRTPDDTIHWAVFWAMQLMIDRLYDNAGLTRHGGVLGGLRFGVADYFPGKVGGQVTDHTVKIDASYPDTWGHPVFMEEKPARKPTGAWLVPGTIATVKVPASMVGKGYQVRVGAHSWDLESKPKVLRLYRCSTVFDLDAREVKVANPLGGAVYIEVPYLADAGVVEVTISNIVRSPFFAMLPHHTTTPAEWRDVESKHAAPWADFQTEKFMMQVPTSWIYNWPDPSTALKEWDQSMDVLNDLMGLPHRHGREVLYAQVDTQLRGRAFHPGYPSGNRGYEPLRDYGGYYTENHLISGPRHALSYEFHEMGHGYLFPKYPGDREAAVNLHHACVMSRLFGMDIDEAFRSSRGTTNRYQTIDTTAVTWMMSDNFESGAGMAPHERQYQLKGHAKFVDVARLFGWQALGDFWKSTQQDHEDGHEWPPVVEDTDHYTVRMSQCAGADLRPLMEFWGIPVIDRDKTGATLGKSGILPSAKVYETLLRYRSLVPTDREAFRAHALAWWGREPVATGFTTERGHAARWSEYDGQRAAKVRAVVDGIIAGYFPGWRP